MRHSILIAGLLALPTVAVAQAYPKRIAVVEGEAEFLEVSRFRGLSLDDNGRVLFYATGPQGQGFYIEYLGDVRAVATTDTAATVNGQTGWSVGYDSGNPPFHNSRFISRGFAGADGPSSTEGLLVYDDVDEAFQFVEGDIRPYSINNAGWVAGFDADSASSFVLAPDSTTLTYFSPDGVNAPGSTDAPMQNVQVWGILEDGRVAFQASAAAPDLTDYSGLFTWSESAGYARLVAAGDLTAIELEPISAPEVKGVSRFGSSVFLADTGGFEPRAIFLARDGSPPTRLHINDFNEPGPDGRRGPDVAPGEPDFFADMWAAKFGPQDDLVIQATRHGPGDWPVAFGEIIYALDDAGELVPVATDGDEAPGTDGLSMLSPFSINPAGDRVYFTAILAELDGTEVDTALFVWHRANDTVELVHRFSEPLDGHVVNLAFDGITVITFDTNGSLRSNPNGVLAALGTNTDGDGVIAVFGQAGVDDPNDPNDPDDPDGGGGCRSLPSGDGAWALALIVLALHRRRGRLCLRAFEAGFTTK